MGLSGVKKRSKLSHDPNNTAWSKNTGNFGHKILSKQGWKPGDFLGAENANHSDHYTAANASHIRVMLREDNLGLGAQLGKSNAETFGLSMFSGLLGRLNGKSDEEVQKKQESLRDAELRAYQANKYGFMNFVSGGLLVGDKMEFPKSTKMEDVKKASQATESQKKESKKRKASDEEDEIVTSEKQRKAGSKSSKDTSEAEESGSASKKSDKRKKQKQVAEEQPKDDSPSSDSSSDEDVKEIKRQSKERRKAEKAAKASKTSGADSELDEKARLKQEKRTRKEERRKRKEEKRRKRAAKEGEAKISTQTSTTTSESEGTATPPVVSGLLPMTGGRHAVRQRYIMQKRMASMNATALKEIFMLQPQPAS